MADEQAPHRRRIADEASAWFARRDAGPMGEAEQRAMQAWMDADPRHRAAFDKLGALWSGLAATPREARVQAGQALRARRGRDRRVIVGGLIAAVGLGGLGGMAGLFGRRPAIQQAYATTIGEQRSVTLADGSRLQLNSATALTVEMSDKHRHVLLKSGEAAFEVTADPARPFVVESQGGSATARGTAYLVRVDGEETIVTVLEHAVDVRYRFAAPVSLKAGQQVRYGQGRISRVIDVDPLAISAWRKGQIMVEDRPVGEVVAEIGRYTPHRVRLEGPRVKARRVSGVFPTDDPMGALETLGEQLGLSVTSQSDGTILVR